MKKTRLIFKTSTLILTILFGLYGCNKDKMDRYKDPSWLGGSNIETLEKAGKYNIYLKLMDKANYRVPISKQLFTLFVPNDSSFEAYFKKRGISSVDDLSEDEAAQLFTLHVLRNPRSSFQLIYEFGYNELQGPDGEYASLFMRKLTNSFALPYTEYVKYASAYKGQTLLMFSNQKYIPLFSMDYLEDIGAALDGSDYTFMYRDSKWGGLMQWHNAMVVPQTYPATIDNLATRTADGFIYYLDQVVPPMPSLDEYISANKDKYGLFWDLAQKFAVYSPGRIDEQDRVLYTKGYRVIFNFADEGGYISDRPERRMANLYTLYLPTDNILQEYLDNTILKYYPSIDSVPEVTISYILQTQISTSLGFISKISKNYYNSYGDAMVIQPSDINSAFMCSNGLLYGMNRVLEPNVFSCVPGRLFFDPKFSTFLEILRQLNLITPLSNPDVDVTLFAPTNNAIAAYDIRYNKTTSTIQWKVQDAFVDMNREQLLFFARDHIYYGKFTNLSSEGFLEMASGNFIHYSNDNIYGAENQFNNTSISVTEKIENDNNGMLYIVDDAIKTRYSMADYISTNPDLSEFSQLMVDAGLLVLNFADPITLQSIPNIQFLAETDKWTAFIPDNNAVTKAKADGIVPTDIEELKRFILYHFVRKNTIFDDGVLSGQFQTSRTTGGAIYSSITITNTKDNLSITDHSGQVIALNHDANANVLVRKGVVHKITSVLKY
jgi:uncharacterized surface protein with fasciclin (FAS1) repeats